jgi:hypothetical protein
MKNFTLNRLANVQIRRVRQLPFPGSVLVEPGQSLHPEDCVAEGDLPAEIYTIDIARGLGVDPSEVISYLVRDLGELLEQDDVIAEIDGALPRLMRVPRGGKLLGCRDGVAIIAAGKRMVRVQAGMIGVVSTILPERGAILTVQGSLVQGVWGNGQVGAGVLRVQTSALEKPISPGEIENFDEGQVIAASFCPGGDLLEKIIQKKPTGLILGSLNPDLVKRAAALPFPVILLGGFGELVPDPSASQILQNRRGEVVCLNACPPDHLKGAWPEVIIPSSQGGMQMPWPFQAELEVGQRVQALSGAQMGGVFIVAGLPKESAILESGLTCKAAVLKLEDGEEITVPRDNLLILGD